MYGRQVKDLLDHFPREQVLLLRYRTLVDHPVDTLDRVSDFLGVERARVASVPSDNSRPFVQHGRRAQTLGAVIRAGARVGQFFPPEVWRRASRPLIAQLHKGGDPNRPALTPEQRAELLEPHLPDIELLEQVTGESYDEWKGYRDGGSFSSRTRSVRPPSR